MEAEDRVNLLAVDDNPSKLLTLSTLLAELGQNVHTASSGREALRLILQHEYAVVLLDVHMPTMDGFETAALIRQRKSSEHTPIIFVTSYPDDTHAARGYQIGAVDYILAPVEPEVLRTKVMVFVELFKKTAQVKTQASVLERRATQLQQLTQASLAINSALSPGQTLQVAADFARSILGAHQAVAVAAPEEKWSAARSAVSLSPESEKAGERPVVRDGAAMVALLFDDGCLRPTAPRRRRIGLGCVPRRGTAGAGGLARGAPDRTRRPALRPASRSRQMRRRLSRRRGRRADAARADELHRHRKRRQRRSPGSQPDEGRVPDDALSRAPDAAGGDRGLDAASAHGATRRRPDRRRPRSDRAQRVGAGQADRRSARRLAHHHRQAPAVPAIGVALRRDRGRDGLDAPRRRRQADRDALRQPCRRGGPDPRRSRPHPADRLEPDLELDQVHAAARPRDRLAPSRRRRVRDRGAGHRAGHDARVPPARVRPVPPGRQLADALARRARNRPGDRPAPHGASRRLHRGRKPRAGTRLGVSRPAACGRAGRRAQHPAGARAPCGGGRTRARLARRNPRPARGGSVGRPGADGRDPAVRRLRGRRHRLGPGGFRGAAEPRGRTCS